MALNDVRKPIFSPPIPPKETQIPTLQTNGLVGFSSLPDQLTQKSLQQGFAFNFLCVGETGIGKSTLIESLFNMKFDFKPCNHELKNVELQSSTVDVEEGNVRVKLTVVETAGFGDQKDKDESIKIISDYIQKQYEMYLREELKIERQLSLYGDTRIHACLYLISPTGHGLKVLDVAALKELSKRVNVLPIIAKSDTISKDELQRFKNKILAELKTNGIDFYKFPVDDETLQEANSRLNSFVPFAVIGSVDFVNQNGKLVRARQYPWGIVEVENETHCDFVKLRESLLRLNVEDLRERTHGVLYEEFRRRRLSEMGLKDGQFVQFYEQLRKQINVSNNQKENFFPQEFVERLKNKQMELEDREKKLVERLITARREYDQGLTTIDMDENELEREIREFEATKQSFLDGKLKKRR